ncbi:hypothetical protein HG535_0G04890 [Zygotorulaspora mrakii]|uniref:Mitochondrial carrier protein n=1 Tax=Zygotorulaspora mrakii TaxID=42260 RepID=A0A7H9B8B3_ZYGMR|nr:uncharacterized protein HG535_0G04890 [Zygotorulaspora mrakii]QLG74606.1 hypothetical protein HG535_0G04890 [Zygotorulaspora mrakii]
MTGENELMSQIAAGSAAAIFQTSATYPFEFLKTGMQLRRALPAAPVFNMMHPIKLYFAGCSALNVGAVVKTSSRFVTFEKACRLMRDPSLPSNAALSGPRLLAAGTITGFMESMWIIPFENIKVTMIENALTVSSRLSGEPEAQKVANKANTRATFHNPKPKLSQAELTFMHYEKHPSVHFFPALKEIYSTRGLRGFFQGAMPTIFRQIGNSTVRFTTYTTLKNFISPSKPLNEFYAFGFGFLSSCSVVALTQPIDVVKTRMQSKYAWKSYKNSINCAYRIFVEEGFTHLWKGWVPRLFKVGLSGGISFGVYQYVENLITVMEHKGYL